MGVLILTSLWRPQPGQSSHLLIYTAVWGLLDGCQQSQLQGQRTTGYSGLHHNDEDGDGDDDDDDDDEGGVGGGGGGGGEEEEGKKDDDDDDVMMMMVMMMMMTRMTMMMMIIKLIYRANFYILGTLIALNTEWHII